MPALPLLYGMAAQVLNLAQVLTEGTVAMGGTVENLQSPILAGKFGERNSSELSRELAARKVLLLAYQQTYPFLFAIARTNVWDRIEP